MKALALTIFASLTLLGCQEIEQEGVDNNKPSQQKAKAKKAGKKAGKKSEKAKRATKTKSLGKKKGKKTTLIVLIKKLKTSPEKTSGYDRDDFAHWSDLDGNGCDMREDVLRQENLKARGKHCFDDRGLWYSAYDGIRSRDSSSLDVDHMVPLAEAYGSGAWRWSAKKKELYANDPYAPSLIAVSAASNRSKSDQDPAEWLPKKKGYLCTYLTNWVLVKSRWKLSLDKREKSTLIKLGKNCPKKKLRVKKR